MTFTDGVLGCLFGLVSILGSSVNCAAQLKEAQQAIDVVAVGKLDSRGVECPTGMVLEQPRTLRTIKRTPNGTTNRPDGAVVVLVDNDNTTHAFLLVRTEGPENSSMIHHFAISPGGTISYLPAIKAVKRPIRWIEGHLDSQGQIHLVWAEEMSYHPNWFPIRLYLAQWNALTWSQPIQVSDKKARPGVTFRGDMALTSAEASSSVDLVWIDWRGNRFFGQYSKPFHRVITDSVGGPARKIRRRSAFVYADGVSAVRDGSAILHFFWSETLSRSSRVVHAASKTARHDGSEILAQCRDYDNHSGMVEPIDSIRGNDGRVCVGWICGAYYNMSTRAGKLSFRCLFHDRWSEGISEVSDRAMDFVWISGPRGIEGMAVQEYEGRGYDDETGHRLSIFNIDNMTSDAATIVARDSFMKLFDAAAGPDGSISVVYGEPRGEQTIAITHRVAIPCSRPTSSGARRAPRR